MKLKFFIILAILLVIILSGCVQQQPQTEDENANMTDNSKVLVGTDDLLKKADTEVGNAQNFEPTKLAIKYNKNEGLVNDVEIITNGLPESLKNYMKTITIAESVDENSALVDVIMLDAYNLVDGNKSSTCEEQSIINKKKQYRAYENGSIIAEGTEAQLSNLILPKEKVSINNGWEYNGLNYAAIGVEKLKLEGKEFNALKITFGGTNKNVIITGYYLFDYENGRILKQYREETYGTNLVMFTNTVTKIMPNAKPEDYKDCQDSEK
ncbi:MAG: hypothetical protein AABW72_01325 [archaeon]